MEPKTQLVDQPTPTTNRKVRTAAGVAAVSAPLAYLITDVLIQLLGAVFPVDGGIEGGVSIVGVALQLLMIAGVVGYSTWKAGYEVREEVVLNADQ